MIVVVTIHEAHRDAELDEHAGESSQLGGVWENKSPVPQLDDFGSVRTCEFARTLGKIEVAVRVPEEQVFFGRSFHSLGSLRGGALCCLQPSHR